MRLSGPDAAAIGVRMLGSLPAPRVAALRTFLDADRQAVDRGIAIHFPAPASFTGEDVLELQGHGGPVVLSMLVDAAVTLGARLAAPGEFSERAFLNGRIDLAQAEAIADLVESGTAQAARAAYRSLAGAFSETIAALAERLVELRIYVEAAIDFPEEEIDFLSDRELARRLDDCGSAIAAALESARNGRRLRDGFRVVIVGPPNAGKSSLMNRLSGDDTAIVTEIAGTTRDILRENIDIDGLAVELIDTAGLRDNPDVIEREGIRRARQAMAAADAVLWIRDIADPGDDQAAETLPEGIPVLVVNNKCDLVAGQAPADGDALVLSAKTGAGIDALRRRLRELAGYHNLGEGAFTARRRHVDALRRAAAHFEAGRDALATTRAGELLAEELRLAGRALGEITGQVTPDDLLGRIFASFCIGK